MQVYLFCTAVRTTLMYEGIYLNMDTLLDSVIVPVYNAENTLHACVKSISEQT